MTLEQLYLALLIGGFVLLASIVGTRVATGVGFPSLLLFLLVGVVLGAYVRLCEARVSGQSLQDSAPLNHQEGGAGHCTIAPRLSGTHDLVSELNLR